MGARGAWIAPRCPCCCAFSRSLRAHAPKMRCGGSERRRHPCWTWSRWGPAFLRPPLRWLLILTAIAVVLASCGPAGLVAPSCGSGGGTRTRARQARPRGADYARRPTDRRLLGPARTPSRLSRATLLWSPTPARGPSILDYASWLEDAAAAQVGKRPIGSSTAANPSPIAPSVGADGMSKSAAGPCRAMPSCGSGTCRGTAWSSPSCAKRLARTEEAFGALRLALERPQSSLGDGTPKGGWSGATHPYAESGRSADNKAAVDNGIELFDPSLRREAAEAVRESGVWKRRASAVVKRRAANFRCG